MTSLKKPSPLDFKTQYGLALDDTDDAIVADYFCGGGGAGTGLEMGLGRPVNAAKNHSSAAIAMHTAQDRTLARALRSLQEHYESNARRYSSHASDLQRGRKATPPTPGVSTDE